MMSKRLCDCKSEIESQNKSVTLDAKRACSRYIASSLKNARTFFRAREKHEFFSYNILFKLNSIYYF